ncbi:MULTISPECIES: LarC family nickel insertion protein [unclassified Yoonia]|uniref:LarC family nickel insertion protein n=1 Tax=unclassified Yoonia TaxID=2629118 RepID=UPI002AFEECD8|nr:MULTISPECIES: LarC family nickel insertion protein [unclassified Yoonia]
MTRHIHLDPIGGLAGDMFIAAMLDASPDLQERVFADISAVLPGDIGTYILHRADVAGLTAAGFQFQPKDQDDHHHHGPMRHFTDFLARIEDADLAPGTAAAAIDILTRLGRAEAAIHGVPLEQVHFHELSDWDALVDVVAAGSISAALAPSGWSCGALPTGRGMVQTAHGLLPVPAPATAAILKGYDWHDDGTPGERVTPTGAAILAHLTGGAGNGHNAGGTSRNIGYGAGTRRFERLPNILRATIYDSAQTSIETITSLSFEIDDMTGEEIACAADHLRDTDGVQDVTLIAATGKKGRPAVRFDVLVAPEHADAVVTAIFAETATIGLRRTEMLRHVLPRQADASPDGLRLKRAERPTGATVKVEHDDLRDLPTLAARRAARTKAES